MLVLVSHLFEYIQEISVLPVNVPEYFYWCFELNKGLFVLKYSLDLFNEKLNYLDRQIDERDVLGVLLLVQNDVVVQIIDDYVDDECELILHFSFWNSCQPFSELSAPFFINVEGLLFILCWLQVHIEKILQLFPLRFLTKILLVDGWDESVHLLRNRVLLFFHFGGSASGALH